LKSAVWKLAQRTPFKCAFCRSPQWSPFRHGTIQPRWVKSPILSRVLSILSFKKSGLTLNNFLRYTRLIFPRWDAIVIILSIFLLTYTYIEAKANYHRGSILVLRFVFSFLSLSNLGTWTLIQLLLFLLYAAISCLPQVSSSHHTIQAVTLTRVLKTSSDPW